MKTQRFETFFDAVIAIIITVLVLKLVQPTAPTFDAVGGLISFYMAYFVCFLMIFNIWHGNHNLFQKIDEIDNKVLFFYGLLLFSMSLLPYFSIWLTLNPHSIDCESMFGLNFLFMQAMYLLSLNAIAKANPGIVLTDFKNINTYLSIIIILIGFALTYTIYPPGIDICIVIAVVYLTLSQNTIKHEIVDSERFEALIDAIVAIVLTIIVLEITMAHSGNLQALFDLKLEFFSYAISFLVCFNYWLYNTNLFHFVKRIDYKVIWTIGISLFILSLVPYLTKFVAENFYAFAPQALYGAEYLAITVSGIFLKRYLIKADPDNVELINVYDNYSFWMVFGVVMIGMVIGYIWWPPAVILSCLITIPLGWVMVKI